MNSLIFEPYSDNILLFLQIVKAAYASTRPRMLGGSATSSLVRRPSGSHSCRTRGTVRGSISILNPKPILWLGFRALGLEGFRAAVPALLFNVSAARLAQSPRAASKNNWALVKGFNLSCHNAETILSTLDP